MLFTFNSLENQSVNEFHLIKRLKCSKHLCLSGFEGYSILQNEL